MRLFRFSIRDLLWLTLVVAVGLGWFVREQRLKAEVKRLAHNVEKWRIKSYMVRGGLGGHVSEFLEGAKTGGFHPPVPVQLD